MLLHTRTKPLAWGTYMRPVHPTHTHRTACICHVTCAGSPAGCFNLVIVLNAVVPSRPAVLAIQRPLCCITSVKRPSPLLFTTFCDLAQTTARRPPSRPQKIDPDEHMITGIERRRIHGDEILTAEEAFLCSSSLGVVGITGWNGATLNLLTGHDGQTGPVVTYLNGLISADTEYRAGSNLHTPIPYGYLSGMREQLM